MAGRNVKHNRRGPRTRAVLSVRFPYTPHRKINMNHVDPELRTYANNGLRSADDWATMGRQIKDGANPRTDMMHRGRAVSLFSRDQTRMGVKVDAAPAAPAVADPA